MIPYKEIDKGVRDIVKTMNRLGFSTTSSCQGHFHQGEEFPVGPYICFQADIRLVRKLQLTLAHMGNRYIYIKGKRGWGLSRQGDLAWRIQIFVDSWRLTWSQEEILLSFGPGKIRQSILEIALAQDWDMLRLALKEFSIRRDHLSDKKTFVIREYTKSSLRKLLK